MPKNNNNKFTITSLFSLPVMRIELDLEKLTEFAQQTCYLNPKSVQVSNKGGWQSENVEKENQYPLKITIEEVSRNMIDLI